MAVSDSKWRSMGMLGTRCGSQLRVEAKGYSVGRRFCLGLGPQGLGVGHYWGSELGPSGAIARGSGPQGRSQLSHV